jgi:hypothetical protein
MVGVGWVGSAGSEARFTDSVRPRGTSGAVSVKEDDFRI